MANDSIIFLCTACETKLTVPWEMAGVVGPCPICQTEIQAPYPISDPAEIPSAIASDPTPTEQPASVPVAEVEIASEPAGREEDEITAIAQPEPEPDFGFEREEFGGIDEEIDLLHREEFTPLAVVEESNSLVEAAEGEFFGEIDEEPAVEIASALVLVEENEILATAAEIFEEPVNDFVPGVPREVADDAPEESAEKVQPTEVAMDLESQILPFPKTPPPYPSGLGPPVSVRPTLAIHPSLAIPQVNLPPQVEVATVEPLPSASLDAHATEKGGAAAALDVALETINLPPPSIVTGIMPKSAAPRLPTRTLPENMKQIPTKRGPTTAYPEPRRTLAVPPLAEADAAFVSTATSDDPSDETASVAKKGAKRRTHRQSRATKVLVMAIFFVLLVATIAVLWTLKNRQAAESLRKDLKTKQVAQTAQAAQVAPAPPPVVVPEPTVAVLVKPKVELPAAEPAATPPPVEPELSTPARAAMTVLEKFLSAQTLAERMPLIETKTPEEELMISCLASGLPKIGRISVEVVENHPTQEVVDYFYHVQFENLTLGTPSVAVLVRTRGTGPPKVVIDPFLDSFGGRISAYASKPSDQVATFQVIIWPLAACYDTKVPNRNDKLTFKLLAKDDTKEIALAYFGKESQTAKMLEDDSHRLSYGKAQIATVDLRWNTKESQVAPFLEVLEVKTLDWNP